MRSALINYKNVQKLAEVNEDKKLRRDGVW